MAAWSMLWFLFAMAPWNGGAIVGATDAIRTLNPYYYYVKPNGW